MRPRRPASPRSQYPPRGEGYIDADEKRAYAGSGDLKRSSGLAGLSFLRSGEWRIIAFLVVLAFFVRLHRLSQPDSVVFDEVHFGKFASKYIKTQYYVDVHPPLAKLLITLAAFVRGFDGSFDFKEIAKPYEDSVPYIAMRFVPALLGVGTIPLAFLTLRAIGCGVTSALLGSTFLLFENGNVTQSRHILLDSPLVFFTALAIYFWVSFWNVDHDRTRAFSDEWWVWLTLTGLALGAVLSSKWVGLFTIATVGVSTVWQLWILLGDTRVSPRLFAKHFLARALCLIAVPMVFYMFMFAIHFAILGSSGDGDGFMSAPFQHTLGGRGMADTYADVALGSEITIRHVNTQGGYLHSHDHAYPGGSHQQQITLYPHRDDNNVWRVLNATEEGAPDPNYATDPVAKLVHGETIKLEHIVTQKRLHSHNVRPPVSEVDWQNEVSGYGFPGFSGDANDNWVVEIESGDGANGKGGKRVVKALTTVFRLRHQLTGCYLFSHKVKLPEWGFEQQEVTCNTNAVKPNSLWYIETNVHPQYGPADQKTNYRLPGFFSKFWELQKVMWTTNSGLTDRHTFDSRPHTWPFLRRGINFWVKDHKQIYLIGNPFVWLLGTSSVVLYIVVRALLILREKRGYQDYNHSKVVKYDAMCGFLTIGWALHYTPFFLMQRQLFLHHYFPALYFAILLSAAVFDLFTASLRPRVRLQIGALLAIIAIWNFVHLSPLTYGSRWTKGKCESAKMLRTWDFSCNEFPEDYSGYLKASTPAIAVPKVTIPGNEGGRAPIVIDDPLGNKQVPEAPKEAAATTGALGNAPVPGHNVFEHKVAQDEKKVESEQAPAPAPAPETSEVAQVGESGDNGEKKGEPLPLQPDDLVTTGGEEPAASTVEAVLENLVPDEVISSASSSMESSVESSVVSSAVESSASKTATDEDLARLQNQLFDE